MNINITLMLQQGATVHTMELYENNAHLLGQSHSTVCIQLCCGTIIYSSHSEEKWLQLCITVIMDVRPGTHLFPGHCIKS